MNACELMQTVEARVADTKGLLAMDESNSTCHKLPWNGDPRSLKVTPFNTRGDWPQRSPILGLIRRHAPSFGGVIAHQVKPEWPPRKPLHCSPWKGK